GPDGGCKDVSVGGGGVAAVHGLHHAALLHIHPPANDGQGTEGTVGGGNAQALTGGGAVQLVQNFQIAALGLIAQAVGQQIIRHQADGVHGALGDGCVARLAPAAHADAAV